MARRDALKARPPAGATRVPAVDALRGVALVAMIAYHFAFDLRWFGVTQSDFERGTFWIAARSTILSSFLLLVGVSLVLAARAGTPFPAFARRVATIAACAIAVSVASHFAFPRTWIHFGVLHCIAVASLAAWPLRRRPWTALALGTAVVALGLTVSHPAFDTRALSWIGFTTFKPPTEDYVPLAPWAGLVFAGIALGHALAKHEFALLDPLTRWPPALHWLGRHSLAVYMLHQPLLLGSLWLALRWR
jgi:uncharacterized membrane protein